MPPHPRSDLDPSTLSGVGTMGVALGSGVIAGVAAAIISHPADSLLSKVLDEVFVEPENYTKPTLSHMMFI